MIRKLNVVWAHVIYGFQWFAKYFLQGFTAGTMFVVLYVGFVLVTASWLVTIFGEERVVRFIDKHPGLFLLTVLLFTVGTCGLGYWAYTADESKMEANLRNRLAKHQGLFKVA